MSKNILFCYTVEFCWNEMKKCKSGRDTLDITFQYLYLIKSVMSTEHEVTFLVPKNVPKYKYPWRYPRKRLPTSGIIKHLNLFQIYIWPYVSNKHMHKLVARSQSNPLDINLCLSRWLSSAHKCIILRPSQTAEKNVHAGHKQNYGPTLVIYM